MGIAATPAHAETIRDQQWHLDTMHADEMWRTSTGKGVTVAVIDSGVDDRLRDLQGQVLPGLDLSKQPGDENSDYEGHGTGMAAVIAATGKRPGGKGSFGLAPGAKILPIRLPKPNEGTKLGSNPELWDSSMSKGIRHAADSGARVINISQASDEEPSGQVGEAVKYALAKGSLIFAGVGNDGEKGNPVMYPAALPGVVGMAAYDRNGRTTKESERGPQVDLVAPGADIFSACGGGTQMCKSHGTSDATALASASAALIWSKYPQWSNNQVLRVLINTAGKAKSGKARTDAGGYGAVRPRIALKTPGDPGPADEYPLPDLAAAAPKSPSPDVSKPAGGTESGKKQPDTAAPASSDDSNFGLWVALGVGAAALIGAAIAVPLVRSRRRSTALPPVPPTAAPAPYPYQPQYPPTYGPPQGGAPNANSPYGGPSGPGQSG
ncbi:type VII secretion-associated serine protease mycosin [Streptomyces sp. NBC_01750]|uniref:type VII secretion-associated serine protease mycosin n=1 Tax=Streptomyces sp. NBC_01750 TaxID=2975928 RepID=UPI002DD8BDDD|nr:type VII secretion-associated serine protease mycosin [Streptomyces sp. NBC_01750]WSD33183.1 type VII secretion-associated serine protease mycosin [Streptomyces sp. NBC_01750]